MQHIDEDVNCLSEEIDTHELDALSFGWSDEWGEKPQSAPLCLPAKDGKRDSERSPEEVLRRYWGYESFRPLQRDIVQSALDGCDTMALLPTGGGKSVCFQVPGLMRQGITLVVTPLISLMKDQVDHLRARGIKAATVHSGMTSDRIRQTMDNCLYGNYKFLYISPERLGSERFRQQISELNIGLLVIDECHCICQWGYDFRPSYLGILSLREYIPNVPLMALTATATPEVVLDIKRILNLGESARFYYKSFYRENLSYSIRYCNDKEAMIKHILTRVDGSAIIYCRRRELCREIARFVQKDLGISATYFHAGLTYTEREIRQERWMRGEYRVMVATNAFGMGIDKPDVRLVIHYMMPSSLEEYFQEAGRAGRDGQLSYAVAIVAQSDERLLHKRYQDAFPSKEYIMHTYDMLCNYFAVGEGEGKDRSYDFDIDHFVRTCRMRPSQTKPALEIMALSGFLEYKEDDASSRVKILYNREDLYGEYVGHDRLLRALLRRYTGLFSDYVFVSETDLSLLTGFTNEEVYGMLTALSNKGVLHYIPKKNIPRIVFRIRREDTRYLQLKRSAYEERKERMQERIESVINYIRRKDTCRSRMLVEYFGEQTELTCGKCDVCLQRVPQGLQEVVVEACRSYLISCREQGEKSIPLHQIRWSLPYEHEDVITAVQYLAVEEMRGSIELVGDLLLFVD